MTPSAAPKGTPLIREEVVCSLQKKDSNMANCIEPGDNPDLTEERRKATFSVRSMSEFIFNGEDKLAKRMEIAAYVDATQDLHDPRPVEFMSRVERHDNSTRKV
uniref:Acyl-coenzyme A oxidase N-terminal domain-containing protein n=1 Tax=Plectus sambesii TaxID=2011161 RepID=A0A914V9P9_9BILA